MAASGQVKSGNFRINTEDDSKVGLMMRRMTAIITEIVVMIIRDYFKAKQQMLEQRQLQSKSLWFICPPCLMPTGYLLI